ncbi:hypothetical protein [Halopiger xanaduensis]|uniref:Uncharacterized protein n=1 Tax=Halopiger xanaduensis (strain DSM 18323 / JCM 14033 / SH-6) TaxID=797210 RepID=F8D5W1_HALXS|nr:hypothetical protein [Halopiger xanaduensis]AEH37687.1 hypothetical protein Halxa_3073 [Halopiger xanaduensis SH-6]
MPVLDPRQLIAGFLGAALVGLLASLLTDRIEPQRALRLAAGVTVGLAAGQLAGSL